MWAGLWPLYLSAFSILGQPTIRDAERQTGTCIHFLDPKPLLCPPPPPLPPVFHFVKVLKDKTEIEISASRSSV